jgi:multiple antibiotic resistance protein
MDMSFQHYLCGLFAVANNIPAIPLYLATTEGLNRTKQNKLCFIASSTSFITMVLAMFAGSAILNFFEITVPAFRIAGGIVLMSTGMAMISSKTGLAVSHGKNDFSQIISVAIVPIAIPLTTGAGTISTVILFAGTIHTWAAFMRLFASIAAMSIITYLSFRYAPKISTLLGSTGMNVLTKIFGLITLALGIQFMIIGLIQSFPALVR